MNVCHQKFKIKNLFLFQIYDISYSPPELNNEAKAIYVDFLTDVAVTFGSDYFRAKYDSEKVLNLFLELAKVSQFVMVLS